MTDWLPEPLPLSQPRDIRAQDPATGVVWHGTERRAELPGLGGAARVAYLVESMLTEEETSKLFDVACNMDWGESAKEDRLSCSVDIMSCGQYEFESWAAMLRPVVDTRLLPYVRHRYNCPGAVVCMAAVHRQASSSSAIPAQCTVDHMYFCSGVLSLNARGADGDILVQRTPSIFSQSVLPMKGGDLFLHQFDIARGAQAKAGREYSVIFYFKDYILACLTNTAPWYEALAEGGNADAQMNLGFHCEKGLGSKGAGIDLASAARWYKAAAEQGHAAAQERLGAFYSAGIGGLARDPTQAVHWWHRSAMQGHRIAQRSHAKMLLRGCGIERNAMEAFRRISQAAEQYDAEAVYLAVIAYSRGVGVQKDERMAILFCERGATLGHAELQFRLGVHYAAGQGLPQDLQAAGMWLRKASANGHAGAQCNLGVLLAQGLLGSPPDAAAARSYFEQASASQDAAARYNLAVMHAHGLGGLAKDLREASKLCELAAVQGHLLARQLVERIKQGGAALLPLPLQYAAVSSTSDATECSQSGTPATKVTVDVSDSQQAHLHKLLSELHVMRSVGARKEIGELMDILQQVSEVAIVSSRQTSDRQNEQNGGLRSGVPPHDGKDLDNGGLQESEQAQLVESITADHSDCAGTCDIVPSTNIQPTRCTVPRVNASRQEDVHRTLDAGRPSLIMDAMPQLSGKRVLDFMPKLMHAAGKEQVTYEVQGAGDEVVVAQAPLALYIQEIQSSAKGRAYLMMDDDVLHHPGLAEFVTPPAFCKVDVGGDLDRPPGPSTRCLLVGGKGACSQLHRNHSCCSSWNFLVLGRVQWQLCPPGGTPSGICAIEPDIKCSHAHFNCHSDSPTNHPDGPEVEVWEVTQEMGEVLFVPPGWWRRFVLEDRSLALFGVGGMDAMPLDARSQVAYRAACSDFHAALRSNSQA